MELPTAINLLKKNGHRITKTRHAILRYMLATHEPVTAPQLMAVLKSENHEVHKTTIYREIEFLLTKKLIIEVPSSQPEKLYEVESLPHHHHATCNKCGSITHFTSHRLEESVVDVIDQLAGEGVVVLSHMVELYGICKQCG